jgi:hypothetical protein
MPGGIVTKPSKPGFVGFGITCLGFYQDFLTEYFSVLPGEDAFIEGPFFRTGPSLLLSGQKGEVALQNH